MIKIDGSYGEGGGQILRTAIALSCVTQEPVEIFNIRANRPKPGLAMQHLKGIEAAKLITNAEVNGLKLGSTRVYFKPRSLKGGEFKIDIGTAGSVTLILQTILLPSLYAENPSKFEIRGGTDVKWSPSIDYFRFVTLKALRELNARVDVEVISRGYYPEGGGRIVVNVEPSILIGRDFEPLTCLIRGISHCQNLPRHVAERQRSSAVEVLPNAEIEVEVRRGISTGSGITLWCGYKGSVALGERGKRAEIVGRECAEGLLKELKLDGIFDKHLADQIMPFSAVARGKTIYTTTDVTMHQTSNAYVINRFFENVKIDGRRVEIDGVGL